MKRLLLVLLLVNVVYLISHQFSGSESDKDASGASAKDADKGSVAEAGPVVVTQANFLLPQEPAQAGPTVAKPGGDTPTEVTVEPSAPVQNPVAKTGATPATDKGCLILGPFTLERRASQAIKAVEKFVESAELTDRDSTVLPDYLVYVGPEESSKLASTKASEFKAQGFDSQVIRSGVLKNVVSLGVFSRRPLADSLVAQIEAVGQAAKIRSLEKNRKGYQVNGSFLPGVRDVLKSRDFPYVECASAS